MSVGISRRQFVCGTAAACGIAISASLPRAASAESPADDNGSLDALPSALPYEDLFAYINRIRGGFDVTLYRQLIGAANPFKEGDASIGVAAANESIRTRSRQLLARTRIADLNAHPVFQDQLTRLLEESVKQPAREQVQELTLGQLKERLLDGSEDDIHAISRGLSSDVIGCVVKLMSNHELTRVGAKLFHPLGNSQIGARGYLGARIQPNSPTDNLDDIRWQVFDGWSYAVGDVLLGTNPVSSDPQSVAAVELALRDILETFALQDAMPHCVLAHIDVQAEVERAHPGSTALWFQSIAGTDGANETFDISIEKMVSYARQRTGRFALYFETGQGADFTNGHGNGFDMVLHESRKYGFTRALKNEVARAKPTKETQPWVHLNDVAGFIGPEVFRTKEQLVRCCLEDIVMGKLHGLTIGLDVCSTLHMEVSLDDLDWCLEQIMPANPAYLMALPTKIDPMLGYLTTGFQDHLRLREKFGYRVNDRIWEFFKEIDVIDGEGQPTDHFGDPVWVYYQYRLRKGDRRSWAEIQAEGRGQIAEVRSRGVFIAEGYGASPADLSPELADDVRRIYTDAKKCIWAELAPEFVAQVPDPVPLATQSIDRNDYILHPPSGEKLNHESLLVLEELRRNRVGAHDVQLVISDGLNALSIMEPGHLEPFLKDLREQLSAHGYNAAKENLVVTSGRVRAGYQIGEVLYRQLDGCRAILHVIGERPGTGHRTFSVYITAPDGRVWSTPGQVDHNITKVVSGIAVTALSPSDAATEVVRLLDLMTATPTR